MQEYLGNDKAVNKIEPLVSVCVMTYRHAKFIEQCLDSILAQQTNFPFEIIVGEDDSPDDTRAICKRYAEQYPDKIRLFLRSREDVMYVDGRPTGRFNMIENVKAARGKYIALCEGDDHWIDKEKLQKQAMFLEANQEYTICCTRGRVVNEMQDKMSTISLPPQKDVFSIDDIIAGTFFFFTATWMYRNIIPHPFPDFFFKTISADIALTLMLCDKGPGKVLPDETAVYRQHSGGISRNEWYESRMERSQFDLFDAFNEYTRGKYKKQIQARVFPMIKKLLMYGSSQLQGKDRRQHVLHVAKGYNKYRDTFNVKEITYYSFVLLLPGVLKLYRNLFAKNKEII